MIDFNRVESLLRELTTIVAPSDEVKCHVNTISTSASMVYRLNGLQTECSTTGRAASPSEMALFREIAQMIHEGPVDQEWYLSKHGGMQLTRHTRRHQMGCSEGDLTGKVVQRKWESCRPSPTSGKSPCKSRFSDEQIVGFSESPRLGRGRGRR
jgi:hypothetical protein